MPKDYLPVKENSNFVQDPENFALLFSNEYEFNNKVASKDLNKRLNTLENTINSMNEDINEIKELLKNLTNGKLK